MANDAIPVPLVKSLDRAISLASKTLKFYKDDQTLAQQEDRFKRSEKSKNKALTSLEKQASWVEMMLDTSDNQIDKAQERMMFDDINETLDEVEADLNRMESKLKKIKNQESNVKKKKLNDLKANLARGHSTLDAITRNFRVMEGDLKMYGKVEQKAEKSFADNLGELKCEIKFVSMFPYPNPNFKKVMVELTEELDDLYKNYTYMPETKKCSNYVLMGRLKTPQALD
ncbi:unnamed protein product [Bursaphelenchus okinawaensis]|uniref:Uncharacterized protein n=1 Tax=Bursaphelenchus okinawaensis TaxID=465554 RepID=A0A811LBP5_9BILA|nr:unnamed protein product [Bursaphelenchus okinawaensis]CAG9120002.1 unnamed protein product [Bursaphelenchus okinawaensis]